MSNVNDRKQKRIRRKKRIRGMSIIFIIFYMVIKAVPSMVATNLKTVFAEEDILIESKLLSGVIIRDEVIYKANSSGKIESDYKEGSKVSAGVEVITINDDYQEDSKKDLTETMETEETEEIEDNINSDEFSTEDLQDMINSGNFEEVHKAKKILEYIEKEKLKEDKNLTLSNDEIKQEINELKNSGRYFAENSGIISYYIDGYESRYSIDTMDLLDYENLIIEKNKESNNLIIEAGKPAYKIIDNFQWYIALKVDDMKVFKNLEVGDLLRLKIDDNPKEFVSRVVNIKNTNNKAVILIRLTEGLHDFTDCRFVDVEVINKKIDGLKVPNKAIIEQEKKTGVFIKDLSGVVRFKEVKVLGKDKINTFVDKGDERSFVEVEQDIRVKTITIFDEIFLNSSTLREGQIID